MKRARPRVGIRQFQRRREFQERISTFLTEWSRERNACVPKWKRVDHEGIPLGCFGGEEKGERKEEKSTKARVDPTSVRKRECI